MNENNNHSALSFDRMRSTLLRAAEIRESEQQQIFDALDEIHARMSPLESLGAVRKRLAELPDRAEVSVLAERLDEALSKLESQDHTLADLGRAVDSLVDRLAKPFAQLDGRLDGVAGRFEGVAGRMDGLEDKLAHIHKRLDDLDGRFDKTDVRLDGLPSAINGPVRDRLEAVEASLAGRLGEIDEGLHEHLDGTRESMQRSLADGGDAIRKLVTESSDGVRNSVTETRESLRKSLTDGTESLRQSVADGHDVLRQSVVDGHDTLRQSLTDGHDTIRQSVSESADAVRQSVSESADAVRQSLTEGHDGLRQSLTEGHDALRQSVAEGTESVRTELGTTRDGVHGKLDEIVARPKAVDHTGQIDSVAARLDQLTSRLDELTGRLDTVEDGVRSRIGELSGSVQSGLDRIDGTLANRPDADRMVSLVRKENEDSERRNAGHLDEAMATFAELIIGGSQPAPLPPTTLPRSPRRRPAKSVAKTGKPAIDGVEEIAEGA